MSRDPVCPSESAADSVPAFAESSLQGPASLQWFPLNHPGFQLFPDGFPDVREVRVNKVSTKPLDIEALRVTQERLQPYLTQAATYSKHGPLPSATLRFHREIGHCHSCRRSYSVLFQELYLLFK